MVYGANTSAQECLRPRLLEDLGPKHIELELVRALDAPDATNPRYRVHAMRGARERYVFVGVLDLGRWFGLARQLKVLSLSPFVRQKMRVFIVRHNREDLVALKELVEAEKVTPVVDRRYELSAVPEALQHQGEGHPRGKIVIAVRPGRGAGSGDLE